MIRKIALQIAVPALLAFMAWNAYLAVNHLKRMQRIAAITLESSAIQADLSDKCEGGRQFGEATLVEFGQSPCIAGVSPASPDEMSV